MLAEDALHSRLRAAVTEPGMTEAEIAAAVEDAATASGSTHLKRSRRAVRLRAGADALSAFLATHYTPAIDPVEREQKRQARELRREWDRLRLELALEGIG